MEEDLRTGDDDEEAGGEEVVASGLPPYVDSIIQGYSQQFGRVISRKITKRKANDTSDRDRLVVTYENGERKRTNVTFRIGSGAREADPNDPNDTGSPGETTIVESVTEEKPTARATAATPPTQNIKMPDGQVHIMERDPATGEYTIDRGLAANQPTPAKPKPSDPSKWKPLMSDGRVVALIDPETGDTQPVTQRDAKTVETRDGRIISISPDGKQATDVTPDDPGSTPFGGGGPKYTPNYSDPASDMGLSKYFESLEQWVQSKGGSQTARRQASQLMTLAGKQAEEAAGHGGKLRDQERANRSDAITQRGQDVDEVASRRTAATNQFENVNTNLSKYAAMLIPSDVSGQTAVDGYRAALRMGQRQVEDFGGLESVAPVAIPGQGAGAVPGAESTQIVMHPGGRIEVSPTGAAPIPAAAPAPAAVAPAGPPARDDWSTNPGAAPSPVNPPAGEAGNDPSAKVGLFDPSDAGGFLAELGLDPAEAENVMALYKRGVRADHL